MLDEGLIEDAMAELELDGDLAVGLLAGFIRDEVSKVGVEKLVRDAIVWTHLAGDAVQRIKVIKHL